MNIIDNFDTFSESSNNIRNNMCKYTRDNNATKLFKKHESDAGYDITLIELVESSKYLRKYRTGIRLEFSENCYGKIYPRSSLHQTGHILANSVGIIDNQYRGELFVVLYKFDTDMPELTLPYRAVQLIIEKPSYNLPIQLVENIDLNTDRSEGGFGSTNN